MKLLDKFLSVLSRYLDTQNNFLIIDISIPKDISIRTELICNYISEEEQCLFDLNTFLLLLYLDFIRGCIENYNPKNILDILTRNYIDNKSFILSNGYEKYEITDNTKSFTTYSISFDKEEAAKGQLILNEIFELFHKNISFNTLIEKIWISFIHQYKTGDNKKAFIHLRKILHENL